MPTVILRSVPCPDGVINDVGLFGTMGTRYVCLCSHCYAQYKDDAPNLLPMVSHYMVYDHYSKWGSPFYNMQASAKQFRGRKYLAEQPPCTLASLVQQDFLRIYNPELLPAGIAIVRLPHFLQGTAYTCLGSNWVHTSDVPVHV